jgi:hypothetical protein
MKRSRPTAGLIFSCLPWLLLLLFFCLILCPNSRADYLNPHTGRFWTRDSYEGNQSDPLSLHKYLYCQDEPVNNIDLSGESVYVVTRPLNIPGGQQLADAGNVHVFLAFTEDDITGIPNLQRWESVVRDSCDPTKHSNSYGITYDIDARLATFSFHPKSVLTGDESEQYWGTILTPGSYNACNNMIDVNAFDKTGIGYKRYLVLTGNEDAQIKLYNSVIQSRDKNNNGHPDLLEYQLSVYNCGSWVQTILARNGITFPDMSINHGVGLTTRSATTKAGYVVNAAARITRTTERAVIDIFNSIPIIP